MWNEYSPLKAVAVRTPENAFVSGDKIDSEWQTLRFHSRPDLAVAIAEHSAFVKILEDFGAKVIPLPGGDGLTLDSLYVRDGALVTPKGLILCHMGRQSRHEEPALDWLYSIPSRLAYL